MNDPEKVWQQRWAYYLTRWLLYIESIALLLLPFGLSYGCGEAFASSVAYHMAYTFPCCAGAVWGIGFFTYRFRREEDRSHQEGRRYFTWSVQFLMVGVIAYLFPLLGSKNGTFALSTLFAVWVAILLATLLCMKVSWLAARWRTALPRSAIVLFALVFGVLIYFLHPSENPQLVCHPLPL